MEARFFASLQSNDTLKWLSKLVKDPNSPSDRMIRQLYVFCRGIKNQDTYEILNTCLVWFSKSFVKLEFIGVDLSDDLELFVRAQYQPNTVAKQFRCLFAVFRSEQLIFSLAKDFNGKGTFFVVVVVLFVIMCECLPVVLFILYIYSFHLTFCIVVPSFYKSFFIYFKEPSVLGGSETLVFVKKSILLTGTSRSNLHGMKTFDRSVLLVMKIRIILSVSSIQK
jgi:hypothetical protein